MQYLYIIAAVLIFFKDFFTDIFKTKEAKAVGIALVTYWVYKNARKPEARQELDEKINTRQPYQEAAILYEALHPWGKMPSWMGGGHWWDGTDEKTAYQVATRMKGRFAELAAAYFEVSGVNLISDLQSEGIYTEFMKIINGTSTGSLPGAGYLGIMEGQTLAVKPNWNIRHYTTGAPLGVTKEGDSYKILSIVYGSPLAGIVGDWVQVKYYPNWVSLGQDAWISKGAFI